MFQLLVNNEILEQRTMICSGKGKNKQIGNKTDGFVPE